MRVAGGRPEVAVGEILLHFLVVFKAAAGQHNGILRADVDLAAIDLDGHTVNDLRLAILNQTGSLRLIPDGDVVALVDVVLKQVISRAVAAEGRRAHARVARHGERREGGRALQLRNSQ